MGVRILLGGRVDEGIREEKRFGWQTGFGEDFSPFGV